MDTAQWPQGIGLVKGVDDEITTSKKPRPSQKEQSINCPRCNSTNTKFCYYNNYSLSQPRYFCKTCRRYWTEGGSLRNVPVGGGSRKNNKRSSSSSSSSYSSSSAKKAVLPDHLSRPNLLDQNHKIHHDLNLAYNPPHHHHNNPFNGVISDFAVEPFGGLDGKNSISTSHHQQFPVMEFLKTGNISDLNSNPVYNSSGFPDFKPSLGFSIDGLGNGYGNLHGVEDHHANNNNASRNVLFPFEELKPVSNNDHGETNGFWSGMLNGGSW